MIVFLCRRVFVVRKGRDVAINEYLVEMLQLILPFGRNVAINIALQRTQN